MHYSQYGRMCPIETPEGPNIGLITSLSTFARINDLGFIETPYRVVKDGRVTNEIRWLSASEEEGYTVAQANAPVDANGKFTDEPGALPRQGDDYPLLPPRPDRLHGREPEQLVSIAAALIPFLEHDDANRALMGSNMQRQSVPLLFPECADGGHRAREQGGLRFRRGDHGAPGGDGHPGDRRRDHRRLRRTGPRWATSRWPGWPRSTATGSRSSGAPTRTPPSTSGRWCR